MTRTLIARITGIAVIALLASGCSTSKIRSNVDPDADFSHYYTWNFIENAGPDSGDYESFFTQYMKEAIEIEMSKRGYTMSDDPDVLVNFNGIVQEKTDIREVPASFNATAG